MRLQDLFEKWNLTGLKVKTPVSVNKARCEDPKHCDAFRQELCELQVDLLNYTKLLSDLADVEDLTEIEETD